MALTLFERPIYIKQKNYMQEIGCLDDVFDLLEDGRKSGGICPMRRS